MTAGPELRFRPRSFVSTLRRPGSTGWWWAAALVMVPGLIPPLSLIWQVAIRGPGPGLPLPRLLELLAATAALTVTVTLTALVIGLAAAWLTERTDLPGRRLWRVVVAIPLVIPSYVAALVIIGATGPGGIIGRVGVALPTPYGFVGAWLALSIFLTPMTFLILAPALRLIDPATEEAAVGLGASPWRVLTTVTLPLLRPAMVSAGLTVSLYTISDFGAVSLLRYDTFTRAIYTLYAGQIDRRPAATLSLILMSLALAILVVESRTRTRAGYHLRTVTRHRQPLRLGRSARIGSITGLGLYATMALVVPIAVLVYWLVRGLGAGAGTTLFWAETGRSVTVALTAAALTAAASIPVAMVTTWRRARISPGVESAIWGVYSLPHITVGVAVVAFALAWAPILYQTLALLIITYVAMFLAQSTSTVQDSLQRANPDLEDASRGLGKRAWVTLGRVIVPVTRPGLAAGAALVFLSVMKELPATLLLRPTGFETLAVRIWSATGEGFYTRASVASLALLSVSILPLLALTNRDLSD